MLYARIIPYINFKPREYVRYVSGARTLMLASKFPVVTETLTRKNCWEVNFVDLLGVIIT